ncbi:MAG TPA: DNA internalization-related competence protein ComEC/Rec2 [Polyangia bacterium]|nr:DNA internalization-related competence protein ComEC/Rec2 [Polyangia bacterium]
MLLPYWCACFAVGIAFAAAASFGAVTCAAAVAVGLSLAAVLGWRRAERIGVGAMLFAAGVLGAYRAAPSADAAPGVNFRGRVDDNQPAQLEGVVAHGPETAAHGTRLVVAIDRVDGQAGSGTLWLSVLAGWPDFGPGERVRFSSRLRAARGLRNPGLADPAVAFRAAGIDALAGVSAAGDITRVGGAPASGPRRWAFRARRAMRAAIEAEVSGEAAAFLRTAVLGERRGVSDEVEAHFRAAGATHVLSVSGLHLAAVAGLFFLCVRALAARVPRLALWIDPRAVAAAVALPALAFFTLLTGEAVATERSALMLAVGMVAFIVGRSPSGPAAVAAAALVLLASSPLLLFDVSLQLSFASVVGMVMLARTLGPRGRPARVWARVGFWLWRFGAATLSATAATAPLVAHHFGEIAPASPLGNLALVPLVEMVVVPCGLFGAAMGAFLPWLGHWPLQMAALATRAALAVAAVFGGHAPVWVCRMPNPFETLALSAGLLLGAGAVVPAARAQRWRLAAALVLLAAALTSLVAREVARRRDPNLRVTFLDVGQGDAAVVEAPGGRTLVIDGGGAYDGSFDPGQRVVEPFLRRRGVTTIDLMALSHPHPDHLGGLQWLAQRFAVRALWTSGDDGKNPAYARLLATAKAHGTPTDPPTTTTFGPLCVEPLGPWLGDRIAAPPGMSVNDASLVLRLSFAGRALLFPGDLEADGEGELVGRATVGQTVHADVLKVPHHGSRTSSSDELLDAVAPSLAVASLGWQNRFRFPSPEVVGRYADRHVRWLRTDLAGAVTVTIDPTGAISVRCERGCP